MYHQQHSASPKLSRDRNGLGRRRRNCVQLSAISHGRSNTWQLGTSGSNLGNKPEGYILDNDVKASPQGQTDPLAH